MRPPSRLAAGVLVGTLLAAVPGLAQTLVRGALVENPDGVPTTLTVQWWTDVAGDSTVEYGLTTALGQSRTVAQAASCEIGAAGTCHAVQLTGLQPGTRYYYRLLTNGVQVQPVTYLTTMKAPGDPGQLFFAVIGDWGQGSSAWSDIAGRVDAADPQVIVTVGDNAYQNGTQSDWDNNALAAYRPVMRRVPFFPALGNHDLNAVGASNWASSVEIRMFREPRNAPAGFEEQFYSFDHGDAHFVVLDSNDPADPTQQAWLAADLAATTRKWKFVFLHHAPYSCASGLFSFGSYLNTIRRLALVGQHKVQVTGSRVTYAVDPTRLPLRATVVLDPPFATTGQCGEAVFPGPPPVPSCAADPAGATVRCR